MTHETTSSETPIDEIYRIRQEISAAYDHDPHKLFLAVVEQQKQCGNVPAKVKFTGAIMLPENWLRSRWKQSAAHSRIHHASKCVPSPKLREESISSDLLRKGNSLKRDCYDRQANPTHD